MFISVESTAAAEPTATATPTLVSTSAWIIFEGFWDWLRAGIELGVPDNPCEICGGKMADCGFEWFVWIDELEVVGRAALGPVVLDRDICEKLPEEDNEERPVKGIEFGGLFVILNTRNVKSLKATARKLLLIEIAVTTLFDDVNDIGRESKGEGSQTTLLLLLKW